MITREFRRAVEKVIATMGAWSDWLPTVTQSGNVTVTVNGARYCIIGKLCFLQANLTITGSGTGGNAVLIGNLPATLSATAMVVGSAKVNDTGTATYAPVVMNAGATALSFFVGGETASLGVTPNFALANNDSIQFSAICEIA